MAGLQRGGSAAAPTKLWQPNDPNLGSAFPTPLANNSAASQNENEFNGAHRSRSISNEQDPPQQQALPREQPSVAQHQPGTSRETFRPCLKYKNDRCCKYDRCCDFGKRGCCRYPHPLINSPPLSNLSTEEILTVDIKIVGSFGWEEAPEPADFKSVAEHFAYMSKRISFPGVPLRLRSRSEVFRTMALEDQCAKKKKPNRYERSPTEAILYTALHYGFDFESEPVDVILPRRAILCPFNVSIDPMEIDVQRLRRGGPIVVRRVIKIDGQQSGNVGSQFGRQLTNKTDDSMQFRIVNVVNIGGSRIMISCEIDSIEEGGEKYLDESKAPDQLFLRYPRELKSTNDWTLDRNNKNKKRWNKRGNDAAHDFVQSFLAGTKTIIAGFKTEVPKQEPRRFTVDVQEVPTDDLVHTEIRRAIALRKVAGFIDWMKQVTPNDNRVYTLRYQTSECFASQGDRATPIISSEMEQLIRQQTMAPKAAVQ